MKKTIPFISLIVLIFEVSFGQNNPVQNLTWWQTYVSPHNFFQLQWTSPALPHNQLLGYNIYRNGELYRFQTETELYFLNSGTMGLISNCNTNFLGIDNQNLPYYNGFEVYVKAVYSPGVIESGYLQTYQTNPPALSTNNYADKNMNLYPNPTSGIINIENVEINKVTIFDILGKSVKEYDNLTKIDLSELSKGIYTLKIIAEKQIFIRKIILK